MLDCFDTAFELLLRHEGTTYTDDPEDRGGATKFGITSRAYGGDVQGLTLEQAKAWYRREYWDRLQLAQLRDVKLSAILLDQAVNRGMGTLVKTVQKALHLTVDGVMGPNTLQALNDERGSNAALSVVQQSILEYAEIAKGNPSQLRFLSGWENRCCSLLDFLFRI